MNSAGRPGKSQRAKGPGKRAAGKRAEETIRESEDKYRFLIDATNTGYVVLDDRGRVVDANLEYVRMTRRDRLEDILGRPVTDWTAPHDLERNAAEVGKSLATGSVRNLEIDYVGPDGAFVPLEFNATVLPGPPVRIFTVCRDISERRRAEEALRESENRTRSIIESIPVGMLQYRLEPGGRLVFTGANPAADRLLGVDNRRFVGRTIEEAFPPLAATEVPQRYREVVKTGAAWRTESIEYQDDLIKGAFAVHAFRTGPDTMVAAFEEITERKRAEVALKESEAKFRRLYNETPVLLHSIDQRGVLLDVNDFWLETMGYERDEVVGRDVTDFYTEASRKYARAVVQPDFFAKGSAKDVAYQFVKKNGEVVDVLLSATGERDAEGRVVRSRAVVVDVTERKRAEEALHRSEARYRLLYEGTPVMMHSIDSEGKLVSVSDHWLKTLGYTRDEVLGRRSTEFLDEDSRVYARDVVLPEFMRSGVCTDIPYTFVTKSGARIATLLSAIAERDQSGRVVRSLAVIIDITDRMQAQEALRKSEERFRAITTTASDAILLMDDQGKIIYWNPAAERIFGFAAGEAVGKDLHAFLAPGRMHGDYHRGFSRFVQTGQGPVVNRSVEMVAVKKDGTEFPIEVSTSAMDIEGRWHALGIVRDITERKKAEEEARRNEARMASLYRISQHSVGNEQEFLDFALNEAIALTGSAIGYLYFYDEARREFDLNSYSRDVMKECSIPGSKSCYELDRTGVWGEAVRQRQPIVMNDFEALHPLKKGYPEGHARLQKFLTTPVIMQGAVVAVVGVANKQTDYTDADVLQLNLLMDSVWKMIQRSRGERALQASEERFRDLAESLPLAVFELDLQGRFTYVNRPALEKFGFTPEDVAAGLTMPQILAPADRDRARAAMGRRLAGGETGHNEYQGLRKDGSTFPITVASSAILRDGRPLGLRGIALDLTERKQLEAERMKTDKLESIGTLAGGIAHDFNNLLQGVFGYISLAKLEIDDREKALAKLEQTEKALHNAVSLAAQLLTFSKGGKPVKHLIDLGPVIENACRFSLSGSRTDCRLALDDELWSVEADQGQVAQMIQNIVLNADQAMPHGGTVEIAAQNVPAGGPGLPEGLAPGRYVQLSITDGGIGIPPEYLTKIFDPYFTTKEKGSGLGLATCYSIARNHGGLITVRSARGAGSTFAIYLPASEERARKVHVTPAPVPPRRGRVLVMDDDTVVLAVAGELLRALGHEAQLTAHGEQAIERYRESLAAGRPFDIVILDLTVRGGLGGQETIRRLREMDAAVKAVVSSGYSADAVTSNFREHGFCAYLSKPYTAARLDETLNKLLS